MIGDEIEALLARSLGRPGLFPVPVAGPDPQLAQRHAELAAVPASAWPEELVARWRAGAIYLRDAASQIAPSTVIDAARVIVRDSHLGPHSYVSGDRVVLEQCRIDSHASLEGPVALVQTRLQSHVVIGTYVIIVQSTVMPFTKIQRHVAIERSAIGSCTAIEGGTHPEKLPLGPDHRVVGARVGADCWVGQHVSISAGGVLGRGVTVAPFTSITRPIGDHLLVVGTPARTFPIDANVRGLSEAAAREEGRLQGHNAARLPVFGPARGYASADRFEVDYPEHGFLRGLASANLLEFQAGVIASMAAQLFPEAAVQVRYAVGASVRFTVELGRPCQVPDEPAVVARAWRQMATWSDQPRASSIDQTLVDMIRSLLPLASAIDVDTPFYALGLDSLGIAELAARIEKQLGVTAPDPFTFNTVRSLAGALESAR